VHDDIYSISEPWILLPYIYATKKTGTLSEYSSLTASTGINDFINNFPNKEEDFINIQRKFIEELYKKQCPNNEMYFLDKTPRYYLIIDEIVELFPNARFIFLFRNPIHIYASIVNTWGKGRFRNIITTYNDLIIGTKKISKAFLKYQDRSYVLNYEEFVSKPEIKIQEICEYLEIPKQENLLTAFSKQETKGSLGDPTGIKKYNTISDKSLYSWKKVFNSIIRKRFAFSLLNKIDNSDLLIQGYDKEKIELEIKTLNNKNNKYLVKDLIDYTLNYIIRKFKLNLFIDKQFSWVRKEQLS